jgi:hypothetical protein
MKTTEDVRMYATEQRLVRTLMTLRSCSYDSDIEMVESFDGLLEGAVV